MPSRVERAVPGPARRPPQSLGRIKMRVGRDQSAGAFRRFPGVEAELNRKLPRFQAAWDQKGVPLLKKVVEEIGLPFPSNLDVSLMVSLTEPSRGLPNNKLQINLVSFLDVSSAGIGMREPLGEDNFVGLVLHEVLHKYVDNNRVQERSTVLPSVPVSWLWGLANPPLVCAHLHSFALEQLAYAPSLTTPRPTLESARGLKS